jgi:hypothetical protein
MICFRISVWAITSFSSSYSDRHGETCAASHCVKRRHGLSSSWQSNLLFVCSTCKTHHSNYYPIDLVAPHVIFSVIESACRLAALLQVNYPMLPIDLVAANSPLRLASAWATPVPGPCVQGAARSGLCFYSLACTLWHAPSALTSPMEQEFFISPVNPLRSSEPDKKNPLHSSKAPACSLPISIFL